MSWNLTRSLPMTSRKTAIGIEKRAAVNDQLQRRPDIDDLFFPRDFFQIIEQREHPRRDAAEHRDRQIRRLLREHLNLFVPVAHQGDFGRRERVRPQRRSEFAGRDAGQVADETAIVVGFQVGAATEEENAAAEDRRAGVLVQEKGEVREGGLFVRRDHLPGDRDVLCVSGRGARRERIVGHEFRPGDARQPGIGHTPVVAPHFFVSAQRHGALKVLNGANGGKIVVAAEFRVLRALHELAQRPQLRLDRIEPVHFAHAHLREAVEEGVGHAPRGPAAGDFLEQGAHAITICRTFIRIYTPSALASTALLRAGHKRFAVASFGLRNQRLELWIGC